MSALSDLLNRRIAESDKFRDMSNRAMATEAGVSRGTIDNYRNGTHPGAPSEDVLQAFHELLGISLVELRETAGVPPGEPEPYSPPAEFNRLSYAQRSALDEFVRSFVGPKENRNGMEGGTPPGAPPQGGPPQKTPDGPGPSSGNGGLELVSDRTKADDPPLPRIPGQRRGKRRPK